jgi:hypothetical protein
MRLIEKIRTLYPELVNNAHLFMDGTIRLQNDMDGKGDYIATWNHPTLAEPTSTQLNSLK